MPQTRQPSWMLSSSFLWVYGFRSSLFSCCRKPSLAVMKICDKIGSRAASRGIPLVVTGDMSIYCIVSIMSASTGTCFGVPPNGRRLRASVCGILGLWIILYFYAAIDVFSPPNKPSSGLWSLIIVNVPLHRYWRNFFSPTVTDRPALSISA